MPCVAHCIKLEPGDAILFRADVPHQGMGYKERNLRVFMAFDIIELPNNDDGISPVQLNHCQQLSLEKCQQAGAFIRKNLRTNKHIKTKKHVKRINKTRDNAQLSERKLRSALQQMQNN